MIRRYVNLVAANKSSRKYSLHRLDAAKHLFYPSTAEAVAANVANKDSNGSEKPSKIGRLRRLPPASMSFQRFPPPTDNCRSPPNDTFMLLSPTNSSESRILHVTEEGPGFLYDAGAWSMSTVPSHNGPVGFDPLFISIAGTRNEKDSIYFLNPHPRHPSFEVLNFNDHPLKWQHLPPPPFFNKSWSHSLSFTVLDGGHTICVSLFDKRTYCYDTRSQKWWQAGDWMMPFAGRAEYVPELNSWLGFSNCSRRSLCASSDLSAMDAHQRAPMLQHDWEDLKTPEEKEESVLNKRFRGAVLTRTRSWRTSSLPNLINLGGGRFCIAKFFEDVHTVRYYYEQDTETDATFVVLTGVEVLRGGSDSEPGLQMVKHKSKRYMFTNGDEIKWVL